ncbi:hypothetical protein HYE67_010385 [Fusarium culmorum]|uniref:Extracellular membrane protein CFEM domain-containing protein n=1 Tax=Fusarium culmorum TaxID=5516 RepID=A0A2T4H5P7_FUSCU|nr:hypothetical protein FCULG_00011415 [Fusarium culmorum]QPC68154.1 hypothetical protein HYE67_010385 [Fusarium culmorum]
MNFVNEMPPEPTAPPILNLHGRAEASDQIILSIAPDSICGFISERAGASRACPANNRCYFFLPQSQEHGGVICCGKTTCQYHATCINSREYFQSSKCDGGCEVDNYTLKWYHYRNTTDYWCNDLDIKTAQSAALTYKGQKETPHFITVDQDDISSIESQMSGARTAGTALGGPKSTSESTSGSTAIETNANGGGSSETPVAAIVGGTVSGIAVLAAAGLGIFFFLRHKKKKQSNAASLPGYQQPPENKSPWSPGQQPGAPYHYDPNTPQSNVSPNSQYMYPQAAGFQPQQNVIHEAGGEAVDPSSQPQELPANKKEPAELA